MKILLLLAFVGRGVHSVWGRRSTMSRPPNQQQSKYVGSKLS